jgi:hypothetical protein
MVIVMEELIPLIKTGGFAGGALAAIFLMVRFAPAIKRTFNLNGESVQSRILVELSQQTEILRGLKEVNLENGRKLDDISMKLVTSIERQSQLQTSINQLPRPGEKAGRRKEH